MKFICLSFIMLITEFALPEEASNHLIKKFSLKNANMVDIVNAINQAIKEYKIDCIEKIEIDKNLISHDQLFVKIEYNDISFEDLLNHTIINPYYYEYIGNGKIIKVMPITEARYFLSSKRRFLVDYAAKNKGFDVANKQHIKNMLKSYSIDVEMSSISYWERDKMIVFDIGSDKRNILNSIVMLYDSGYQVIKVVP